MSDPLVTLVELQQASCQVTSPLYGSVLKAVAAEVEDGGACATVLRACPGDPLGSALVLRFLGAVHRIVLEGRAPALAGHYPSVGGVPGPDVAGTFLAVVADHVDELVRTVEAPVQTNEVGRSAVLLGGFLTLARLGRPLRVLEVGASAGLNLQWDRFRYEAGDWSFGPTHSPVRFLDPWAGGVPPGLPEKCDVVYRAGCDPSPIDPATDDGARLVRSFVWPDQLDRLARFDAAIEVAGRDPAPVESVGAAEWLDDELAALEAGAVTVVVHSIVFQYLEPADRTRMLQLIEGAGARTDRQAPLAWLRLEPGSWSDAELRLTVWPGQREVLLARSTYHGPPVRWLDAG